ncbi:aspartate 1-decarboxylase autocleavage activator PanM [Motilimonas eburnea]|uniref:aspartate 1-decarboxylase autocleavage activator PanM n=1 Tax=Motilimonas eburnea TaxID=1737488 RepID=UPI001E630FCA|nr:aspartate 1-decarboxylase autocleavage activator PanM [Motilimonas eburnea]MCE2573520.1 aspartate 1-decarboxylase autocleavage activator PanM [Motilimonas eburnea]
MRLSAFSPQHVEPQLLIDLKKIYQPVWPATALSEEALTRLVQQANPQLYVAMFNQRHIAAAQITLAEQVASVSQLVVRDITRGRGVGKYLLTEIEKAVKEQGAKAIDCVNPTGNADYAAFLQAMGYQLNDQHWSKTL